MIIQEWWYGDDHKLADELLEYCREPGNDPDHIIDGGIWAQIDFMCGNDDDDDDSEDHVPGWLKDQFGIPRDICKYYVDQWNAKIKNPNGFKEYEKILGLDFGLSVHISWQHVTDSVDESFHQFWIDRYGDDVEAIQAFLAFPSPTISHKIGNILYFGVPVNESLSFFTSSPPPLTEDQVRLFKRATKFLNLKPWLNEVAILSLDKEHVDSLLEKLNQGDFSDLTVDEFGERISERLKEKEGEA